MLEIRGLRVSHGRIRAVQGIDLDVGAGEIVALIGANGAGKSSTLRAIVGLEKPEAGDIRFGGLSIAGRAPDAIMALGIALVPEGRMILGTLTVRENLRLGAYARGGGDGADIARVVAAFPDLAGRLDAAGSALSGGQAQMLALARGLMARPKLLLLDEPSLGLSPRYTEEAFGLIGRLRGDGHTILLVEQNLHAALAVADRAYVIESGRIAMAGPAAELARDGRLGRVYLGLKE